MYVSKYYTCEEIDQRLLQGYYDDFVSAGFVGTVNEFLAFVLSIKNKVDKKDGYELSKNDFTDILKAKLDGIEEKANYITLVSQLINDKKYQTLDEVKKLISDLVDGADDALDTLKELAEALGNDPNFATTITNKLTDLRTALSEEISRAKGEEAKLATALKALNDNFLKAIDLLNEKVDTINVALVKEINRVEVKVDKNTSDISSLKSDTIGQIADAKVYAKDLVDTEAIARKAADDKLNQSIHELENKHITNMGEIKSLIDNESLARSNADSALDSKINDEVVNRQSDTQMLQSKIDKEEVDRKSADTLTNEKLSQEVINRENANSILNNEINKEAQKRESADSVLQNNIDNEASTRIAQDLILDHKVTDVDTKVDKVNEDLLSDLALETKNRIDADTALDIKKVDKKDGYELSKNDFTDILKAKLNGIEEKANYITLVSQLVNDVGYQTEAEVEAAIQKIIGSAPEVLDTLEEIARALGEDPNFASTITKKLAAITEQVNQEIVDRTSSDTVLQNNINMEVTNRKAADLEVESKLKTYVDVEIDKVKVDANTIAKDLSKEVADRIAADTVLRTDLDKEVVDRKNADVAHNTSITSLNKAISDLALDFQDKVNILKNTLEQRLNQIDISINNLVNKDKATDIRLSDIETDVSSNYLELKGLVTEEITDRTNADSSLNSKVETLTIGLNTEISQRTSADSVIQSKLDKEVVDRKAEDTRIKTELSSSIATTNAAQDVVIGNLSSRLDSEVVNRTTAIGTLNTKIDSNKSLSDQSQGITNANVTKVGSDLASEVNRSTTKDLELESELETMKLNHRDDLVAISKDINVESNTRLIEDNKLQNNIDKEVVDRKNADQLLSNRLVQETADRTTDIEDINNKKVDKIDNKGLSTNDFTDVLFAKLTRIEEMANYITKVSQLTNDSNYQTEAEVEAAIQKIIGSAPGILDTLEEIARALGDDPNFATTITNKLNELGKAIADETLARETGDNTINQSFTNLSNVLNATVNDLRTFVSETRTELLTSLNSSNALITQNTANIQRNLELIQKIQDEPGFNYTAIKDLLESEIMARKSEDIRIEGILDSNIQDLKDEIADRIAADKALGGRIDTEITNRTNADTALGKRIDKEVTDRTNADTVLRNSLNTEITNRTNADTALGKRIDKEVTDRTNADTALDTKIDLEINDRNEGDRALRESLDKEIVDRKNAGTTLDNKYKDITDGHNTRLLADEAVSDSLPDMVHAGFLSSNTYPNVVSFQISTYSKDETTNKYKSYPDGYQEIFIDSASEYNAGVMSAEDRVKLDGLDPHSFIDSSISNEKDNVILYFELDGDAGNNLLHLKAATKDYAGVMSAADKVKLDTTLPNLITKETTDRKAEDVKLTNLINALSTKHDTFANTKGKANGLASLDANGTVPANQLPSFVDDIVEVYATYTKSPTGTLSNIKLYKEAAHTNLIPGETGKIYQNITTGEVGYQFRWSGTQFAQINTGGVIIGEITGTAYDGGKGNFMRQQVDNLGSRGFIYNLDTDPTQSNDGIVFYYKYQDGSSFPKSSISINNAGTDKHGLLSSLGYRKIFTELPNAISSEVTNRKQAITDLDIALKKYVDDKVAVINTSANTLKSTVDAHVANKTNPHAVTKTQVGLGNVANTAPADLPVSAAQATSIASAKAVGTAAQTAIDDHIALNDNPHAVSRAQLGLATTDTVTFAKTTAPSGFFKEASDERLKSNIVDTKHTLEQICKIPTKNFIIQGSEDEGTIAQGLEEIGLGNYVEETPVYKNRVENPGDFETVVIDGEEFVMVKVVKYHKMSTLAIEGIKLLKSEIEELRSELNQLKNNK